METFNDGLERRARSWADRLDSGHRDPTTDEKAAFFLHELRRELLPLLKAAEDVAMRYHGANHIPLSNLQAQVSKWKS